MKTKNNASRINKIRSQVPSPNREMLGKHRVTEKEIARYWDNNADLWTDHVARGWDLYREYLNNPAFLKLIGNQKGKKVLDAGCGEGHNTRILARQGARVTGIDISSRMIAHARAIEKKKPLGIHYKVASFTDLKSLGSKGFDTVVSFMAMMDSPDFGKAVREIYRILKPGGDFFFNISHPCFMTIGFDWIRDNEGNGVKLVQSNYFSREHYIERWKFSGVPDKNAVPPFTIPYFSGTLSGYINPLAQAGFIIKKIQEPRPSLKLCREQPEFQRWRNTGAIFLHFHARKP